MLYDPKWEQRTETKPDLSLASFIAWLERQPCDGIYDADDASNCAIAQWLRSMDVAEFMVGDVSTLFAGGHDIIYPPGGEYEQSFGAALKRARAAFASA